MVKAIFFDIDGTLVSFDTHKVPESTKEAIEISRKKGIKVFIATGRHISAISNLDGMIFDGYITMNGCYCIEGSDNVIFKKSIEQSDINSFIDYLENRELFPCAFVEEKDLSVNYVDRDMEFLLNLLNKKDVTSRPLEYYRDKEIFQLTAFFRDAQEKAVMAVLPNSSAMRWYPTFADVITRGVDKGVGMDKLCDYIGISIEDTMSFGDGGNDIEMLRHAGIGVAMGNANNGVKENADYVTTSVDNDGVLNALRYYKIL
jgi:Cof subfamily protein (haloacid dehalogenase superfamily)